MNKIDQLQDMLETEINDQGLYNNYLVETINPEVRQLFTQFRDEHMQNITLLQQQIQQLMQNKE